MKERPIIFSTPMVQAILEGRKTQTRRVIKPQPVVGEDKWEWGGTRPKALRKTGAITTYGIGVLPSDDGSMFQYSCPYGKPGDLLWVRETHAWVMYDHAHDLLEGARDRNRYVYKASMHEGWMEYAKEKYGYKWKPSIHMPEEAARIWLKVVDVRVELLKDISEDDAIAEGVEKIADYGTTSYRLYTKPDSAYSDIDAVWSFTSLWESIHGKDSWKSNPWVWVIEFEVVSKTGRP